MSSGAGATGWNIEGWVRWLYARLDFDPRRPPGGYALAEAALGAGAVDPVGPQALPGVPARLVRLPERHLPGAFEGTLDLYIQVRRKLEMERQMFLIGHELAEWVWRDVVGITEPDIEEQANALGAGFLLPREAVVWGKKGPVDDRAARTFCVPLPCYALRWAEVTGEPVALVTPNGCHRRGEGWPADDTELRRWARRDEPPLLRGHKVTREYLPGRRVILVG